MLQRGKPAEPTRTNETLQLPTLMLTLMRVGLNPKTISHKVTCVSL